MLGGLIRAVMGRAVVDSPESFQRELIAVAGKVRNIDPSALNRRLLSLAEAKDNRLAKQTVRLTRRIQSIERHRGNPAKYWRKMTALYSSCIRSGRSNLSQVIGVKQLLRVELALQGQQLAIRSNPKEASAAQGFRNVTDGGIASLNNKLAIMNGKRGNGAQSIQVEIKGELASVGEQLKERFNELLRAKPNDPEWKGAVSRLKTRNPCISRGFTGVRELVASGEESNFPAFESTVEKATDELKQLLRDFDSSVAGIANKVTPAEAAQAQTEIQFLSLRLGELGLDERQQANVFRALGWNMPRYVPPKNSEQSPASTPGATLADGSVDKKADISYGTTPITEYSSSPVEPHLPKDRQEEAKQPDQEALVAVERTARGQSERQTSRGASRFDEIQDAEFEIRRSYGSPAGGGSGGPTSRFPQIAGGDPGPFDPPVRARPKVPVEFPRPVLQLRYTSDPEMAAAEAAVTELKERSSDLAKATLANGATKDTVRPFAAMLDKAVTNLTNVLSSNPRNKGMLEPLIKLGTSVAQIDNIAFGADFAVNLGIKLSDWLGSLVKVVNQVLPSGVKKLSLTTEQRLDDPSDQPRP